MAGTALSCISLINPNKALRRHTITEKFCYVMDYDVYKDFFPYSSYLGAEIKVSATDAAAGTELKLSPMGNDCELTDKFLFERIYAYGVVANTVNNISVDAILFAYKFDRASIDESGVTYLLPFKSYQLSGSGGAGTTTAKTVKGDDTCPIFLMCQDYPDWDVECAKADVWVLKITNISGDATQADFHLGILLRG